MIEGNSRLRLRHSHTLSAIWLVHRAAHRFSPLPWAYENCRRRSFGLIGSALVSHLRSSGHEVMRLVRNRHSRADDARYWNPATGDIDDDAFDGIDGVVNLAGAGIGDRRWSERRKRDLRLSRVDATELLVEAMGAAAPARGPGGRLRGRLLRKPGRRGAR